MKRSVVNEVIGSCIEFLAERRFPLPAFAYWAPSQWWNVPDSVAGIIQRRLGWDVTDFGSGDFWTTGLVSFTLRNGAPGDTSNTVQATYAEKIMVLAPGQTVPVHLHRSKTEDIINRGGGQLELRVWQKDVDTGLSDRDVVLEGDGEHLTVSAGGALVVRAGASVTIPCELYHALSAQGERVLVGEVSTRNDDEADNRFLEPMTRFPQIDEDEAMRFFLVADYERIAAPPQSRNRVI